MQVIDHSVSKENFKLVYDDVLDMYRTEPQPSLEELPKYYQSEDYISHTNARRNVFEKLYHIVRSHMLESKLKLVFKYCSKKGQLLDVGCGTGDFLKAAQNSGWSVTGIEPNATARDLVRDKGVEVFDVEALIDFEANTFNVITLWHVLEHLPNLDEHINRFKTLLKPNGILIIAVPNFKSADAHHYKSAWAAYDVPRHLWHFSKTAITKIFAKYMFHMEDIKPMWFDAFYVSILSEKIKGSKFSFIKGLILGLYSNLRGCFSGEISSHIYVLREKS